MTGETETTPDYPTAHLTPRQCRLLAFLSEGRTITDSAKLAGYPERSAKQRGHEVVKRIRGQASALMDEFGLTEAALIQRYLLPALNAQETEFAKHEGKITDAVDVVAWGPRLTALDIAAKMKGMYALPDGASVASNVSIGIEIIGGNVTVETK